MSESNESMEHGSPNESSQQVSYNRTYDDDTKEKYVDWIKNKTL